MKTFVKRWLRQKGWDLHRYVPALSPHAQLGLLLDSFAIDLVLDVGANGGQYGLLLRELGYRQRIMSFEPLTDAHAQLAEVSKADAHWTIAPRAAIGAEDGEIAINIAGNSASSSILPMLAEHADAAPHSRYVGTEHVALRRLDSIDVGPSTAMLLKIDTQGFEAAVLAGAPETLQRAAAVQIELSLVPLYDGGPLYDVVIARLRALGFELWALWPEFTRPGDGRLLQMEALFARPERSRLHTAAVQTNE